MWNSLNDDGWKNISKYVIRLTDVKSYARRKRNKSAVYLTKKKKKPLGNKIRMSWIDWNNDKYGQFSKYIKNVWRFNIKQIAYCILFNENTFKMFPIDLDPGLCLRLFNCTLGVNYLLLAIFWPKIRGITCGMQRCIFSSNNFIRRISSCMSIYLFFAVKWKQF